METDTHKPAVPRTRRRVEPNRGVGMNIFYQKKEKRHEGDLDGHVACKLEADSFEVGLRRVVAGCCSPLMSESERRLKEGCTSQARR